MKDRRADQTGRSTGRPISARRKRSKIEGQFVAMRVEMIASPAWAALSLSARRALDRICIEHASHGGVENGRLPVTYDDFVAFGIHRNAIGPALRELEALGFIEVTERGRAGNAGFRSPNRFRVTFLHTPSGPATDDWKTVTREQAELVAAAARRSTPRPSRHLKLVRAGA